MLADIPELFIKHAGTMLDGVLITLLVSSLAIALGMVLGLMLCFALVSRRAWLRRSSLTYQSFFRGTPVLVQLLIVYYFLPVAGIDVPPIVAAVAALTMNTTAFQAEIFRGGLLSIPAGQFEAARVLGIGKWQARRRILVPQMMRLVLPALVNETITILKNSSLVSVIAVTELVRVSQQIVAVNFRAAEIYIIAAGMYLVMTLTLSYIGSLAERRYAEYL